MVQSYEELLNFALQRRVQGGQGFIQKKQAG
jgi:hypothetical protein